MIDDDDSSALIGQLATGFSNDLWFRFTEVYNPLILGWLRRRGIPADIAEDVRQEVLLKVYGEIGSFRHNGRPGAFRAWLRMIMVHRLRTIQRQRLKSPRTGMAEWADVAEGLEDGGSDASRSWDQEHDHHLVNRLLDRISGDFQETTIEAFRRVVLQEENAADVAAELGMTVNALRVNQSRVLSALRKAGPHLLE